jgi:hypothetical protein
MVDLLSWHSTLKYNDITPPPKIFLKYLTERGKVSKILTCCFDVNLLVDWQIDWPISIGKGYHHADNSNRGIGTSAITRLTIAINTVSRDLAHHDHADNSNRSIGTSAVTRLIMAINTVNRDLAHHYQTDNSKHQYWRRETTYHSHQ